MNHWQMIAIAYGLSVAAIGVEIALLRRRRRAALHQVRNGDAADGEER